MDVLALITARGGSVTLPRKNILPFCGKPLIAHSIEAARAAQEAGAAIDRIVVSTDDEEIAEISRRHGAEVPFIRPASLSGPDTPSLPVVKHAVEFLEKRRSRAYEWIFLLQPTSPLRTAADILEALALAAKPGTTAVIGVTSANSSHPVKLRLIEGEVLKYYLKDGEGQKRRQDFAYDIYRTNGAVYLARRDVLMEQESFYGSRPLALVMPPERSVDIDTELDFEIAAFLFKRNRTRSGKMH
jgi:N-acylneuraminate cytidylyltransferase/CMP-N,N'-diacetyllegionaminic acid synthase